jgi:hypothetical protein
MIASNYSQRKTKVVPNHLTPILEAPWYITRSYRYSHYYELPTTTTTTIHIDNIGGGGRLLITMFI